MKKVRFALVAIIAAVLVLCLTGCGPLLGGKAKKESPSRPLSFNVSGATAVASTEKSPGNRSAFRAADSANEKVLKILEDGTVESLINFPEDIDPGTLEYFVVDELAVSPAPDAEEIYLVINRGYGSTPYGGLLCVHPDGTFTDIPHFPAVSYSGTYIPEIKKAEHSDSFLSFDLLGNVYFEMSVPDRISEANAVYKYNPETDSITKLTAGASGNCLQRVCHQ